uniref:Endonuclease/exonuclease/phosphatase domain-containing protein n=1 Tax=Gadus morhua TaxID=8049 RepID=A0A8C5A3H8_GADMO
MTTIELLRWNVKGISNKTKRYKIITHLKSLESDVAMLQETYLKNTEAVKLRKRLDKDGRYIIIPGFLHKIKCTLVNVNAPNIGQAKFLPRLNFFLDFSADPIVIGGDFNLVSDPAVDRSR